MLRGAARAKVFREVQRQLERSNDIETADEIADDLMELFNPGAITRKRKLCLFGGPGVGKTTWMRSAPGLVETPTEDANCRDSSQSFPIATSFDQLCKYLKEVRTKKHEFQWLGIDSLTMVEKMIRTEVCNKDGVDSIELVQKGYGKGFTITAEIYQSFLAGLTRINTARDMGIILLAHARIEKQDDPGLDSYGKYVMSMHDKLNKATIEWCDEVFFARSVVYTNKEKEGFKNKTTAISKGNRALYTCDTPANAGKRRLDLPDTIPMLKENGFSEYAKYF